MIYKSLLPFIPSFLIGFLAVSLLWPGRVRQNFLFKLFLAQGLGTGISSCLYFLWCLVAPPRSPAYWLLELAALVGLFYLSWRAGKWEKQFETPSGLLVSRIALILSLVLAAVLFYASYDFYILSFMQPHGIQDAWGIWNMRARFMFRGESDWTVVFSPLLYWLHHSDYPFLITAGVARAWAMLGEETFRVPLVQAGLFTFATAGLLLSGLYTTRSLGQGIIAAIVLLSTPWFLIYGSWQISDIPLSFFFLAALILLCLYLQQPASGLLALAGLSAGFAGWAKNEGLPFIIIFTILVVFSLVFNNLPKPKILWRTILPYFGGLLLPAAALMVLKIFLAPPSDLFVEQSSLTLMDSLLSTERYSLTAAYLWRSLIAFGQWPVPILFGLALYFIFLLRTNLTRPEKSGIFGTSLATISMFAVYFIIYLVTPHDLVWHLKTSTSRLLYHLFPLILWVIFISVHTPEELLGNLWDLYKQKFK